MSDSGDGVAAVAFLLFAAGPATGFFTYWSIHRKYRNQEARYRPDVVVDHKVTSLTGDDRPVGRFTVRNSSTEGRNENTPDKRAGIARVFHGELPEPPAPADADASAAEGEAEQPPA